MAKPAKCLDRERDLADTAERLFPDAQPLRIHRRVARRALQEGAKRLGADMFGEI